MKRITSILLFGLFLVAGCGDSTPTSAPNQNPEPAVPGPKGKDGKPDPKKPGFG
jgi:hypothetical protein